MNYQSYTLANGIRIVHRQTAGDVSYCGFFINAGTRDEFTDEFGMAHFVEHMLFKGTKKRHSFRIINRMEAVGGDLNAYTNKEETVIYSAFLEPHFERAFELLSDLVFHSEFPQHEIDKEIDVILDEINSYEDSPSELIFDEFENIVFSNSQLGHNILGEPSTLEKFDASSARKFVNRNYTPENIVFFSLGKTDFKKVVKLAAKFIPDVFSPLERQRRITPSGISPVSKRIAKDTAQSHVMIGGCAYSLHDTKRKTLGLLNNILGGPGMNSRLNISLREKRGYVYNVESNVTAYTDTGLFSIYFGTDKQNTEKCLKLVYLELNKLKDTKLSSSQLAAAKKQLRGQIGVSSDNHENIALSLGKSFMHHNRVNSMEETFRRIESISSEDILDVANEIFDEKNIFQLIFS